jgi:hypothetical protein
MSRAAPASEPGWTASRAAAGPDQDIWTLQKEGIHEKIIMRLNKLCHRLAVISPFEPAKNLDRAQIQQDGVVRQV